MKAFAIAALALVGCTSLPPATDEKPAAPAPIDPLVQCDGMRANTLLGRVVDAALQREALRRTDARVVRIIPPGAMVTMDYRGNRLNIDTDAANRATRFHCG